ncbi:MAG: hypothetical protein IJM51_11065 [Clostridia bacterium]|nr:hypothetical protein [Clostridia bacterium]
MQFNILLSVLLSDGTINGVDVRSPLTAMLNARAADPTSLATGAFVGRIDGDVTIEKCKVVNCTVKTKQTEFEKSSNGKEGKIVGVGGFVGSSQGEFEYENLSTLLGAVPTVLADVLNVIPGLGLGDLITILLDNTVNLGSLIPVGYHQPTMFYAVGSFLLVSGVMLLLLRRKTGAKKSAGEPVHADVELDLSNFSDFIKYLKN